MILSKGRVLQDTKAQRAAVIELKRQRNSANPSDKRTQFFQVTLDDMITIGDAIVAGVKCASISNEDVEENTGGTQHDGATQASRVTVTSGSAFGFAVSHSTLLLQYAPSLCPSIALCPHLARKDARVSLSLMSSCVTDVV